MITALIFNNILIKQSLLKWTPFVRQNLTKGVFIMPNRRKYSDEFKLKVVEEYQSGVVSKVVSNIFRKFIFVRQLNAPYPADSFSVSSLVETR